MEGMRRNLQWEEVLKLLVSTVTKGLGFDRAGIFLLRGDGVTVELAMGIDKNGKFEKNTHSFKISNIPNHDPFSDIVFKHKAFFLSNNIPKRRSKVGGKLYTVDPDVMNHAIVPLQVGRGEITGLLAVDNLFKPRFISKGDLAVLINFATQAGLALESYRLHEKITNLTITDPLTGAFNRRYFDRCLSSEVSRCQRYNRPCGLLYADIDFFKRVNDRWGHGTGDEVLRNVAFSLRSGVRNLDTVCRIGGEEFGIILPETPVEGMKKVAERLVESVAENSLARESQKITISIGLACYPESAKDSSALVELADKSLYRAKESGRNRVGPLVAV
jgi:diguanylate cyclase (GGDEF)-like protein